MFRFHVGPAQRVLVLALLAVAGTAGVAADARGQAEPNTLVPLGVIRYAPSAFPERVVASPGEDAARELGIAWRTGTTVSAPVVEIAVAGDSPDMGDRRSVSARTVAVDSESGAAHHHLARIDGLEPDTLYAYRVQGDGTWSAWSHYRTAGGGEAPLTLLYFGDSQNKNLSLTTRVMREAQRHAPDARLVLHAGDLVSGGDGQDDTEWGEWFDALGPLAPMLANAPAPGNHEYFEEFEDTPQERRVLGRHWPATFALPRNGAPGAEETTYWFDYQGVRVAVIDGTSALDLGTAEAQAAWLDGVLADNPQPWSIVLMHQPIYAPRAGRNNVALREHVAPVIERHRVDLVLQGHDHVYARRPGEDAAAATPVYVVSVAGAKQYRLSDLAEGTMHPIAEDTQLFQVIRIADGRLRYEARTATGRLYDAFELSGPRGARVRSEDEDGRIDIRRCPREATPTGRTDRCWE
ncbi:metallophosphoesterase [Coralloluteibacterium thermophilus]|uniref:Metallophosphoesterase n=1 Tax=Coralloluteibacterium thermophilum TaxID=2707049 RepID=A0ABV9NIA4_9GAMM